MVGDEAAVAARIDAYAAAGADDIVIVPAATDEDPAAENTLRVVAGIRERVSLSEDGARMDYQEITLRTCRTGSPRSPCIVRSG